MAPVLYGRVPPDELALGKSEEPEDEDVEGAEEKMLPSGTPPTPVHEPATPTSRGNRAARFAGALSVLVGSFILGIGFRSHFQPPTQQPPPSTPTSATINLQAVAPGQPGPASGTWQPLPISAVATAAAAMPAGAAAPVLLATMAAKGGGAAPAPAREGSAAPPAVSTPAANTPAAPVWVSTSRAAPSTAASPTTAKATAPPSTAKVASFPATTNSSNASARPVAGQLPAACRRLRGSGLRRLKMPPEEHLERTFRSFANHEDSFYNRTNPLWPLVHNGTKAVVVLDSPATLKGNYARARQGHRETWFQRPGVCAPHRHQEPECVLFPVFPMTAGGMPYKKCAISLSALKQAEENAQQDNLTSPNKSESFLLKWEEPYVQPWWEPRSLTHDVPRHMVMLKTCLVRYPWMTHFVKQDLDAYPYYFWTLPFISQPPAGNATKTGHVYFGQWKIMGVWQGPKKKNHTGLHKIDRDCGGVPSGNGGYKAWACGKKPGIYDKRWGGNFVSVDYHAANDGWCNDWSMVDKDPGCFRYKGGMGICSGFMYGHVWSYTRSLAQAIVDSRDPKMFAFHAQDLAHSDIRAGGWVSRVALGANESVELRAGCGDMPWRHFG